MFDLSAVTLLCVDTRSPELALWAMKRCMSHAHFANAVLMTEQDKVQHLSRWPSGFLSNEHRGIIL